MSLVRAAQREIVASDGSTGKTVGGTMMVAGTGGLGLVGLAAFVPFVGVFGLSVLLLVLGAIFYMASGKK